mmetsp:Transcript_323/g.494  ORF Transcript_323/g.494 Transcript_323/m.494 type:complete len:223 (+) Transcript_323:114-782(+)
MEGDVCRPLARLPRRPRQRIRHRRHGPRVRRAVPHDAERAVDALALPGDQPRALFAHLGVPRRPVPQDAPPRHRLQRVGLLHDLRLVRAALLDSRALPRAGGVHAGVGPAERAGDGRGHRADGDAGQLVRHPAGLGSPRRAGRRRLRQLCLGEAALRQRERLAGRLLHARARRRRAGGRHAPLRARPPRRLPVRARGRLLLQFPLGALAAATDQDVRADHDL